MLRALTAAAAVFIAATGVAYAAGEAEHPHDYPFSFDSPVGKYDMAAVQRGFQVYSQVCSSCHAMEHLSYRHLGEQGGPFAAYMERDHETGEMRLRPVPGPPEHGGRFVDVTENQWVRAIAAAVTISDIDPNTGEQIDRPGRVSDRFRSPFANEIAARAANGGAYPPDLSVITAARHGGADYVYSLLIGYNGEDEGALYGNQYFPGGRLAMPPPLAEGAVAYSDTEVPQTVEQYAADVTAFLQWATDPHMEERNRMGIIVLTFLLVLSGLMYLAYKQVWRGESH
jgi:cytochrome c1